MRPELARKSKLLQPREGGATRGRRDRLDIIVEILKNSQNGTRKTRIMEEVGMSYNQLRKYLDILKRENLLSEESDIWKTTEKGFQIVEACRICHRLMNEMS